MANFYKVVAAVKSDKVVLQAKGVDAQPNYSQESLSNFVYKLADYGKAFCSYSFYIPEIHVGNTGNKPRPGHNLSPKAMVNYIEKCNPTFTMTISWIKTRTGRKFPAPKLVISTQPAPGLQPSHKKDLPQEIEID